MTVNETPQVHNVTELPAPKAKKLHNPFGKKNDTATADTSETNTPKKVKAPHGVYVAGALLLAGGAVAAIASKLGKKDDVDSENSDVDDPNDN